VETYSVRVRLSFLEKMLMAVFNPLELFEDIKYEKPSQSFNYFTNFIWVIVIMYMMATQQYQLDATIVNAAVLIALLFVKAIIFIFLFTCLAHLTTKALGGVESVDKTFQALVYGTTPLLLGATFAETALLLRASLGIFTVPLGLMILFVGVALSLHRQYVLLAAYHYRAEQQVLFTGMQKQKIFFGLLISVIVFLFVGSTASNLIDQNLSMFKKSSRSVASAICETTGPYSDICYFYFARSGLDEDLCNKAGYEADDCFYSLAREKKDETICLSISTERKDFCIEELAIVKNSPQLCGTAGSRRGTCYYTLATVLKDPNLCAYSEEERENCFYDMAKELLNETLCLEAGIKRDRCGGEVDALKKFGQ